MTKAALFGNDIIIIDNVYGGGRKERIAQIADLYPVVINDENFDPHAHDLKDMEAIFCSWGIPRIEEDRLTQMPNLKAVFYAASSVKRFAGSLMDHGITVVSAWSGNAICVAEFLLGEILLANKGFFRNESAGTLYRTPVSHRQLRGNGQLSEGWSGRATIDRIVEVIHAKNCCI